MIVLLTCLGARNAINRTALKQTRKNPVTVSSGCQAFTDELRYQARKCRGSLFCPLFLNLGKETRLVSESECSENVLARSLHVACCAFGVWRDSTASYSFCRKKYKYSDKIGKWRFHSQNT